MSGTVITHLLTTSADPQRGVHWSPDPTGYLPLILTARHHGSRVVLIHDEPLTCDTLAETVQVTGGSEDVYWRRWRHTLAWLTEHTEVDEVFATDGTDVVMLRSPWGQIEPGRVYVGSEPSILANRWMLKGHRHPELQHFMRHNARATLYNAGIVGGKRADVIEFVTALLATYERLRATGDVGSDMATLNLVAHEWGERVVTGPSVHSTYKAYRDNGTAWLMHK